MTIDVKEIKKFQRLIRAYYLKHRRKMPWRDTTDPYKIFVSEVMLQQTQVSRVIPKYLNFIRVFPSVAILAKASAGNVIQLWQGLGYNRRALYLHRSAQIIVKDFKGKVPMQEDVLLKLPGIGKGTAGAVVTYAANAPVGFIETNVRTVFIHYFFPYTEKVSDEEIWPLVTETMDTKNPREWFYALTDYGAYLKGEGDRAARRSKTYSKQSPFVGSNRQIRGAILKVVAMKKKTNYKKLFSSIDRSHKEIERIVDSLVAEGFLLKKRGHIMLA